MEGGFGLAGTGNLFDVEGKVGAEVDFVEDVIVEEVRCYFEDQFVEEVTETRPWYVGGWIVWGMKGHCRCSGYGMGFEDECSKELVPVLRLAPEIEGN